jgi:phytanoyl-CoA dioxygenase PhyH
VLNRWQIQDFEDNGFTVFPQCLDQQTVETLCLHLADNSHAQRNLLDLPIVRDLVVSQPVKQMVAVLLGTECFAVRGILFNKTPNSNWKVVWHQDRTIAVRERKDSPHFGPWTVKAGVPHVQPPVTVMAKMVAIRLHLDESHERNGPLRVVPGSHQAGCLSAEEIAKMEGAAKCYLHRPQRRCAADASSVGPCFVFLSKA